MSWTNSLWWSAIPEKEFTVLEISEVNSPRIAIQKKRIRRISRKMSVALLTPSAPDVLKNRLKMFIHHWSGVGNTPCHRFPISKQYSLTNQGQCTVLKILTYTPFTRWSWLYERSSCARRAVVVHSSSWLDELAIWSFEWCNIANIHEAARRALVVCSTSWLGERS